ncbi:MAG: transcription repressor NadR [Finegoldia sp.]|nr:transcription repressor NadR [Finegoldia sp.]
MNKVDKRREEIIEVLEKSNYPVSGKELAEKFKVSRQIIVQDIAALKEKDYLIISTNKGYILESINKPQRIIKSSHTDEDTEVELNCIIDLGGVVKDVFVNHRVYGIIRADLNIKCRQDVKNFMDDLEKGVSKPLKNITGNYHYHTIIADSEEVLDQIEASLEDKKFLVKK